MNPLHFWKRIEGDVTAERLRPLPVAQIGKRLMKYHAAHPDRAEMEEFLRTGIFRWRYLGIGTIYTVDGVTQYAMPAKGQKVRRADLPVPIAALRRL